MHFVQSLYLFFQAICPLRSSFYDSLFFSLHTGIFTCWDAISFTFEYSGKSTRADFRSWTVGSLEGISLPAIFGGIFLSRNSTLVFQQDTDECRTIICRIFQIFTFVCRSIYLALLEKVPLRSLNLFPLFVHWMVSLLLKFWKRGNMWLIPCFNHAFLNGVLINLLLIVFLVQCGCIWWHIGLPMRRR